MTTAASEVTGGRANREPLNLFLPGSPANPNPTLSVVVEVFLFDGKNLLQLTNLGRQDTFAQGHAKSEAVSGQGRRPEQGLWSRAESS